MHYITELETTVREGPGRPRRVNLGQRTVVKGRTGKGKSRLGWGLELSVSAEVNDFLGRGSVKLPGDLILLSPQREDGLSSVATFDDGSMAKHLLTVDKKGSVTVTHTVPPWLGSSPWCFPVRVVAEALRGSAENVRKFLMPFVAKSVSAKDIARMFPTRYQSDESALIHGGLPTTVEGVVATVAVASARVSEERARKKSAEALSKELAQVLDVDPTDQGLAMAKADVDHLRTVVENAARLEGSAGSRAQRVALTAQIAQRRTQLAGADAWLNATYPVPAEVPPASSRDTTIRETLAIAQRVNRANHAAGFAQCFSCGGEVNGPKLDNWLGVLNAEATAVQGRLTAWDSAVATRAEAVKRREAGIAEVKKYISDTEAMERALQALGPDTDQGDAVLPATSLEVARDTLGQAERLYQRMQEIRGQHAGRMRVQDTIADANEKEAWWSSYKDVLNTVITQILDAGVSEFCQAVQKWLPPDLQFYLQLQDGKREICRIGFMENGHFNLGSGGQEAALWLALAHTILDRLPDRDRLQYVCMTIPDERNIDGDFLTQMMKALMDSPYQILILATEGPKGRAVKGWTVLDLQEFYAVAKPVVETPASAVAKAPEQPSPVTDEQRASRLATQMTSAAAQALTSLFNNGSNDDDAPPDGFGETGEA